MAGRMSNIEAARMKWNPDTMILLMLILWLCRSSIQIGIIPPTSFSDIRCKLPDSNTPLTE